MIDPLIIVRKKKRDSAFASCAYPFHAVKGGGWEPAGIGHNYWKGCGQSKGSKVRVHGGTDVLPDHQNTGGVRNVSLAHTLEQ